MCDGLNPAAGEVEVGDGAWSEDAECVQALGGKIDMTVRIEWSRRDEEHRLRPNELLRLVVEDTGAGGDSSQFTTGRQRGVGLNNVEKRLNCYDNNSAHMQITSRPGIGTEVELVLPMQSQ